MTAAPSLASSLESKISRLRAREVAPMRDDNSRINKNKH